jgi:hypothetical protein
MNLDTAIQDMLLKSTDRDIEDLAWLARKERPDTIERYHAAYGWTIAECEEFLDNATLAYELLVKDQAA